MRSPFASLAKLNRKAAERDTQQRCPKDEKHRTDINWGNPKNWNWTAIGTCIIALFTIVIAGVSCLQWRTLQGQLNEMHDQRRPWLAINRVVSTQSLIWFDDLKPLLSFRVEVKVMGQMPAQKIRASGTIVPNASTVNMLTSQMEVCDRLSAPPAPNSQRIERTVFPDQIQEIEVGAINETNAFYELRQSGFTMIVPTIIGCAVYEEPRGHNHRTGFVYDLLMKNPAVAGNVQPIALTPGTIPATALEFRPNFWGNGPAD